MTNETMTDLTVAKTILQQLGGRRFLLMTGARNIVGTSNSLTFRLPRNGTDGSNVWIITLDPSDTYHVETFFARAGACKKKSDFTDIYWDSLVELFERVSGFYTRL